MNIKILFQTLLRHALTFGAGFAGFLLSLGWITADQVAQVDASTAQVITGAVGLLAALAMRGLMLLIARFPALRFLGEGNSNSMGSGGNGPSGSLLPLFLVTLSLLSMLTMGCGANNNPLSDVTVNRGSFFISNADRSAKGGLSFGTGGVGVFGRLTTDDGNVIEGEFFPTLAPSAITGSK